MAKPPICFYCETIYPVLDPHAEQAIIGGAEVQQVLIARELLKIGYPICFITGDYGQADPTHIGDVRIHATYRDGAGLPVLRFFYPKVVRLWKALCRSEASIYYYRMAGFELAFIVLFARKYGRKVVFCSASDIDFNPVRIHLSHWRDKALYFWGLRRCDAIVAQNGAQRELLWKYFGRPATVIHNGYPSCERPNTLHDGSILWVANLQRRKRPGLFTELARRVPNGKFVMVGGARFHGPTAEKRLEQDIVTEAKRLPNLIYRGFLPLEQTEREFRKARLLIGTSEPEQEGFPNTFLQAWSKGIPVISFADPDELISRHGLGVVVRNLDQMVGVVNVVLEGRRQFSPLGIKEFFDANLTMEKIARDYDRLFTSLASTADG